MNVARAEADRAGNIISSEGARAGKHVYQMPLMRGKKDEIWISAARHTNT